MYIPPGFTVVTCEPVNEEAFRAWATDNGGVWHPAESEPHRRGHVAWEFPSGCEIAACLETPSEEETARWTPRMHAPPQSVIDIEIEEYASSDDEQWTPLIRALLTQWDSYAYDSTVPEWISALLCDLLPTERIIRYEPGRAQSAADALPRFPAHGRPDLAGLAAGNERLETAADRHRKWGMVLFRLLCALCSSDSMRR